MLVSPELEVWLLADPDMSSSWRSLARALDLTSAIPLLEVTHRRRLASDKDKLAEVLRRWREGPVPYTVDTLLRALDIMVSGHQKQALAHHLVYCINTGNFALILAATFFN